MKSLSRSVSQIEPKATVVVIRNGPLGRSTDSLTRASAVASFSNTSRAVAYRVSPGSVSFSPRAWRWNKGTPRLSSSVPI